MPQSEADDEVAELARTLEGMLRELDAARGETEAMLVRQRQFVADASHELRTPLTSVLANLELLAESLHGDQGEAARSALRSSQRMRRLVADLLLLARTDAAAWSPHEPCDLAQIVVEAAAELGPVSAEHEISLDVEPRGRRRLARRTAPPRRSTSRERAAPHPPGTEIRVSTAADRAARRVLVVGTTARASRRELRATLFERFVRGAGDRGGSFGLGPRDRPRRGRVPRWHASRSSSGDATGPSGARFVVRLPGATQTSTTTGSTIGRRLRRS